VTKLETRFYEEIADTMALALVIMAAGMGSRFGGNKQLVDVGPNGEVFFDFAITDAKKAGVDRVVLIVRREFHDIVESHVREFHGDELDLHLVCQDESDAPPRAKPWGTAHAILTAAPVVDRPFIVVNADDYYGVESYREVADAMRAAGPTTAIVAGFELGRTMPEKGAVSRGVLHMDGSGRLTKIVETHGIARGDDGVIRSEDPPGELTDMTPVSMNMLAFPPSLMDDLARMWPIFLAEHRDHPKAEFLLPTSVGELMAEGRLDVRVVPTASDWIGVTNADDLEPARATLAALRS
jgi:NDP-sugar pyrophosphorylase family protein